MIQAKAKLPEGVDHIVYAAPDLKEALAPGIGIQVNQGNRFQLCARSLGENGEIKIQ